jgi:PAS domain S-box-containing protein
LNNTVYILGILLQAVAALIALSQVRISPRKLPWLLIAFASILIVFRRAATLNEFLAANRPLAAAEVLTLVISFLFFCGVLLMSRMFKDIQKGNSALRISEERHRSVLETAIDGFVLVNATGSIVEVNEAYCRMSGYSEKELLSMEIKDLEDEMTPDAIDDLLKKIGEQGSTRLESWHRRKDGTRFAVDVSFHYSPKEGFISSFLKDITERKRLEEDLARGRTILQELIDKTRTQLVYLDRDFYFVAVNDAYARTCHMRPEEMIGKNHFALYPHEENEAIFRRARDTGEAVFYKDKPFVFPDQPERGVTYWDWTLTPVKDGTGAVEGLVFSLVETTETKRAEEEIRVMAERLRLANKATNDVIWDWDVIHDTQQWNETGTVVFGWTEIVERPVNAHWWVERVHPDDRQRVHDSFFAVVDNPDLSVWHDEYRFIKTSGSYSDVLDRGYVLRDDQGRAVRMIGAMQDITERKKADEALKTSLFEKEALLKEVHHRVKNNLASILALLKLQSREVDDPSAREAFGALSGRIESMALIHEKLYQSENLSRIDFQDYLQTLLLHLRVSLSAPDNLTFTVEARGVSLDINIAVPCGLLVNELITNIIKHAFPGGNPRPGCRSCEVLISMERDGSYYTLTVADNGKGIPANLKLEDTETMGLLLVRMLGEHQLGGRVDIDRTAGTRVVLTFKPSRMK